MTAALIVYAAAIPAVWLVQMVWSRPFRDWPDLLVCAAVMVAVAALWPLCALLLAADGVQRRVDGRRRDRHFRLTDDEAEVPR